MLPALNAEEAGTRAAKALYPLQALSGGGGLAAAEEEGNVDFIDDRMMRRIHAVLDSPLEETAEVPWWVIVRVTLGALRRRLWARVMNRKLDVIHPDFDGSSDTMRWLLEHITEWDALHTIYHEEMVEGERNKERATYWLKMTQGAAVRNRLRMACRKLRAAIAARAYQDEIRIVSIACGSAIAELYAVRWAKEQGYNATVVLVDKKSRPLDYAATIARYWGISDRVTCHRRDAEEPLKLDGKFDIVEIVGFMDYRQFKQAIKLLRTAMDLLVRGGMCIIANVSQHWHRVFLHGVMKWRMVHRTRWEVALLLWYVGFSAVRRETDPLGGHHLGMALKP